MNIYQAEINDGLEQILSSSKSSTISYASCLYPANTKEKTIFQSTASQDDDDLYYVRSILVTSNWNKNDDIFDKAEVWKARKTPEDKPTNLEHDEKTIIGHIVSNWAIDDSGAVIPDDTDIASLPDKYHIVTGSVVYKNFIDEELRARSEQLINEIQQGNKYVSMECYFKGFDYGLLNASGEFKVIARNAETAFLTKHLRAYGGTGEHDSYKVGRVLREITFSGKGFVNKPANPESIIFLPKTSAFESGEKNNDFSKTGVINYNSNSNSKNGEKMNVEQHIEELTNTIASVKKDYDAQIEKTQSEISGLQSTNQELTKELETIMSNQNATEKVLAEKEELLVQANETIESLKAEAEKILAEKTAELEALAKKYNEDKEKMEEEMKKTKSELDVANETIAGYKTKEEEMMKKEKKMARKAQLIESGLDSTKADELVEKFDSLDDEVFATITSTVSEVSTKTQVVAESSTVDTAVDTDKSEANQTETTVDADASVLEDVELEDVADLSVGSELSKEVENTRADLVDFVYSRLGKKLKKGE